jgi:hypothetical protein
VLVFTGVNVAETATADVTVPSQRLRVFPDVHALPGAFSVARILAPARKSQSGWILT